MRPFLSPVLAAALSFTVAACGSSTTTTTSSDNDATLGGDVSFGTSGSVTGAADEHCKGKDMPKVDPMACTSAVDDDAHAGMDMSGMGGGDAATMPDDATSGGDGGMGPMDDEGPAMFGTSGLDDDCKYGLKWQSTGAGLNQDIWFQLDVTYAADGKPATKVAETTNPIVIEAYVDNGDPTKNHPALVNGQTSQEDAAVPGRYIVGPVKFDQAAQWTVRFHLYGVCNDGETSPHGHGAFLFAVK